MDAYNQPPSRSFSAAPTTSSAALSTNITRVALGPILTLNSTFNRALEAEDHIFLKCSKLLRQLEQVPEMEPYVASAHAAAERCAEQQALALSQQLQGQDNGGGTLAFRASVGSLGFLIYSDHLGALNSNMSLPISNNVFTFTAGVLPANLSVDPATHVWKLFQQGAPLCIIFNLVDLDPTHAIAVTKSDDLRMCKKAVYDFLIAVKTHLNFDDDNMFTISNVFSDNTHDLLKILNVVTSLLDSRKLQPDSTEISDFTQSLCDLKITDEKSKVFREIIQTERKYISDLELLMEYKDELQNSDALSSEQLHVLFPNLSDIVDFHRRLLTGLECNINVPVKYQRIGSAFIHASNGPFKAYEPWTIGQISAIELITKESPTLRKASKLLDPGFELQSYIIKPIQRLCKYPLLLKELIKSYSDLIDSAGYNELLLAGQAMKEVANHVNEAQRRAENVGHLQGLMERVKNWRGFNLKEQGDLLFHSVVAVKDGESEKDYVAYLFDNIIFFFIETLPVEKQREKKKREILGSRKKSSASVSSSTANLLESLNSVREQSLLELKGRVFISEIYNISSANLSGYTLIISWSGKKESGSFTLRFRTEEPRNQWESCLRQLKTSEMKTQIQRRIRDSHGSLNTHDSYEGANNYANGSPASFAVADSPTQILNGQRHNSGSSQFSMMKFSRSNQARASSSSYNGLVNPDSLLASASSLIQIKLVYNKNPVEDILTVPSNILFQELWLKISAHVAAVNHEDVVLLKLKYKDEDGDIVIMDSADDWSLAVDMVEEQEPDRVLLIWAS